MDTLTHPRSLVNLGMVYGSGFAIFSHTISLTPWLSIIPVHIPLYIYICMDVYIYVNKKINIYIYIYTHLYICVHMYICIHMSMYMYIYMCIYIIITKSLWHHHLLIFTTSPSSFSWAPGNVTTSSFPSPGSCDRNARGITQKTYGGFNGDTLKWMVYNGKSYRHGCFFGGKRSVYKWMI